MSKGDFEMLGKGARRIFNLPFDGRREWVRIFNRVPHPVNGPGGSYQTRKEL